MTNKLLWILYAVYAFTTIVNAGTVVLEAGPFAIIMNEDMEISEFSNFESWNLIGFEPIKSRELIKAALPDNTRPEIMELFNTSHNHYSLEIGSVLVDGEAGLVSKYPTIIEISEAPSDSTFLFTPIPVKEVTVGRLRPINTTLQTGNFRELTPYFVNFTIDGIYCTVYDPITFEYSMIEFLENFDVIWKEDLGTYDLSKLWSEE